jgi:hypothetical protein
MKFSTLSFNPSSYRNKPKDVANVLTMAEPNDELRT